MRLTNHFPMRSNEFKLRSSTMMALHVAFPSSRNWHPDWRTEGWLLLLCRLDHSFRGRWTEGDAQGENKETKVLFSANPFLLCGFLCETQKGHISMKCYSVYCPLENGCHPTEYRRRCTGLKTIENRVRGHAVLATKWEHSAQDVQGDVSLCIQNDRMRFIIALWTLIKYFESK